ncbi:MAG: FprA family A-type flavoprotein [bacterium]
MPFREIKKGVYSVGAVDWDRRLFDELIPLPDGTSYNSYLIKTSDKTALIDTVDPAKADILLENLTSLGIRKIDYVIANHTEQDHSGTIPTILKKFPESMLVTNPKCKDFCISHLHISEEKFYEVKDGDTLSLGDKTLEFIIAPWVHWPETMFTYSQEDRILFPCDLFGSHLASSELYATDEMHVYPAAKRYYAEIMMPFRNNIKKHMAKLKNYDINVIAPSHGPVHKKPSFIMNAYEDWISDKVKNEVLIPYVSMHGSVERMVKYLVECLIQEGITVRPFNLTKTDIGDLAMALVDAATIVIASPTVLTGPHPAVIYATYLANLLRPKTRFASIIGSYGWGGKMPETIQGMIGNLKVELIQPVITRGNPREEDFKALNQMAAAILAKHKSIKII